MLKTVERFPSVLDVAQTNVFAGSPLDRLDHRRRDDSWIRQSLEAPQTRFLPVVGGQPGVLGDKEPRLAWADRSILERCADKPEPILLGGYEDEVFFAIDASRVDNPTEALEIQGLGFPDLRGVATRLSPADAAIAAQARHLVDWHARHGFCPGCGQTTRPKDAGWARVCSACNTEHFPRTDPVVIMLVRKGDSCLLGRQKAWPQPFFSALAGFVEPGETLEEAVRREVREEASIIVDTVAYHSTQPWPFPASLMIGCVAHAVSEDIVVDDAELEEAQWFTRDDVAAALRRPTDKLALPPRLAIAHQLLRAWVEEES